VGRNLLVSLFVSVVLLVELEVLTTDCDGVGHLHGGNGASQDTATNRDVAGEWALLVDEGTFSCVLWGLEAQTDVTGEPEFGPVDTTCAENTLLVLEDGRLLLVAPLGLLRQIHGG